MHSLLHSRHTYVIIAVSAAAAVLVMATVITRGEPAARVTTTVERGTVERLVSVSGVIEAQQSAELAFPVSGIVSTVTVSEGDTVAAGDVLVTVQSDALQADRADALAARARAIATRDELAAGADVTARAASAETITLKEKTLETTVVTQAELVANAERALLSSNLSAYSPDANEEAVAPTVTGTYTCGNEGTYTLTMYGSDTRSGYSYQLSGLETGTYPAAVEQPGPLGTCGLQVQFDADSNYRNSVWVIEIPNTKASTFVANRNALALAETQAASAIALAEQDLALARATANTTNAPARSEAIARATADIASANARLARVDAQLGDRVLRAPFAGTVTAVDILPGETVTTVPIVTLVTKANFELTARIPEIDIGKLETGQKIRALFDARADTVLTGTIEFIALEATEIDGVAYYEAIINLDDNPDWLRSGLNADVDIVVTQATDVLRVPKRFVQTNNDRSQIVVQEGEQLATTTVDVLLQGDDGYVAITGVTEGAVIVAP